MSIPNLSIPFCQLQPQAEIETYQRSLSTIQQQRQFMDPLSSRMQSNYQLEMGTRLCFVRLLINQQLYQNAREQVSCVQQLALIAENAQVSMQACERLSERIDQLHPLKDG